MQQFTRSKERPEMMRFMAAALAAFLTTTMPAAAQQPPGPVGRDRPERQERQDAPRDRGERPPPREAAWPGADGHGGGRLSPQEREQLRRDINAHGRDIYRRDQGRR